MLIRPIVVFGKWKRKDAGYLRVPFTEETSIQHQRYLKSSMRKVSQLPIVAVGSLRSWPRVVVGSMNPVKWLGVSNAVVTINGGG